MAKLTIKLAPSSLRMAMFLAENKPALIEAHKSSYTIMPSFHVYYYGKDGAEEAFDLTNNPARQEEREERYGCHRSVSVGDIVEVDGVDFLCDDFGWLEL
jgi:hypothetical protein